MAQVQLYYAKINNQLPACGFDYSSDIEAEDLKETIKPVTFPPKCTCGQELALVKKTKSQDGLFYRCPSHKTLIIGKKNPQFCSLVCKKKPHFLSKNYL